LTSAPVNSVIAVSTKPITKTTAAIRRTPVGESSEVASSTQSAAGR